MTRINVVEPSELHNKHIMGDIMNRVCLIYKDKSYYWSEVYKICGLCREDFMYDNSGSWGYFVECLEGFKGDEK